MLVTETHELLGLLKAIEQRSRAHVIPLPERDQPDHSWRGVVFKTCNRCVVARLKEVAEILSCPSSVTRVPGTQAWFRGVTNIRGNLLPVVDLNLFLGGDPIATSRRSRILVIKQQGIDVGLLVQEVVGMRRRLTDKVPLEQSLSGDFFAAYVQELAEEAGESWPVFSMQRLAEDPVFRIAAS